MESDSDDRSEASTATTARRAWELQGDEPRNDENDDERNEENEERNAAQAEEPTGTDGIHENAPGDSREPADAATRTIGSVRPRFAQDRLWTGTGRRCGWSSKKGI